MHIIGAIIGAVMTGLFYWIIFGNGKQAIDMWLDKKNEDAKHKQNADMSLEAREKERRAAIRSITDTREAAVAVMVAVAEARGTLTEEQKAEIKAQMRTVLGYDNALDHHLTVAQHASRRAESAKTVIDETAGLFNDNLNKRERGDLIRMVELVAGMHGGATDEQQGLIERLTRVVGGARF